MVVGVIVLLQLFWLRFVHKERENDEYIIITVKNDNNDNIEELLNAEVKLLNGDCSLAVFTFNGTEKRGIESRELEIVYQANSV